jgi:hypothetical protein
MDLKSNLLVDQIPSSAPYKDLEKSQPKTVCEGNEVEILKELNKIKQTLNNSQNGQIMISNKGKFTKKSLAVAGLLAGSVLLNTYLLLKQNVSTPAIAQLSLVQNATLGDRLNEFIENGPVRTTH